MTDLKLPPHLHAERAAKKEETRKDKMLEAMSVRQQRIIDYVEGLERFIVSYADKEIMGPEDQLFFEKLEKKHVSSN